MGINKKFTFINTLDKLHNKLETSDKEKLLLRLPLMNHSITTSSHLQKGENVKNFQKLIIM